MDNRKPCTTALQQAVAVQRFGQGLARRPTIKPRGAAPFVSLTLKTGTVLKTTVAAVASLALLETLRETSRLYSVP